MAALPTWRGSPTASAAGSPLTASASSPATLSFGHSRRWSGRVVGSLPRSSPPGSTPPPLPAAEKLDPGTAERELASIGRSDVLAVRESGDGSGSVEGRPRRALTTKLFGRRPLWKRILFASKKVRGIILLNVVTVVYASDIPVLKEVEMITDPALFTCVRFAVSAIAFLPFVLLAGRDSQIRTAGIELGIWVSLGYLSQALGLLTSEAGHASFISAITVVAVPLIDGLFGAKVPALTWGGAIVSLLGVAVLEGGGSSPSVGDILNFFSAVFFGIHMLRTEYISRSIKREKFLGLLGYEVIVVALSSAAWFLFRDIFADVEHSSLVSMQWSNVWDWAVSFPWIPALYTGLFSTGLCLWAEMEAMRNISATEAAVIYGLEPVWGAAFAWFLLGERWGTTEWLGAALVICGSLTVQIFGSSPDKSRTGEESSKQNHNGLDKQNDLSLSTVVVNSRKDPADLFRKKKKL